SNQRVEGNALHLDRERLTLYALRASSTSTAIVLARCGGGSGNAFGGAGAFAGGGFFGAEDFFHAPAVFAGDDVADAFFRAATAGVVAPGGVGETVVEGDFLAGGDVAAGGDPDVAADIVGLGVGRAAVVDVAGGVPGDVAV